MKKIFVFLTIILIVACKNEVKYEDDIKLCSLLTEMTKNDQRLRSLPELTDPFFKILDSLKTANNISKDDYMSFTTEEQLKWGKKARAIVNKKPKVSKKVKDSIWKIQIEIDNKNTETLINIVKERGWPKKDSLNCSTEMIPVLIFRHAPEKYWKEIKPLIEKEYAEKRMGKGDYWFIDNHIKGRPMPASGNTIIIE